MKEKVKFIITKIPFSAFFIKIYKDLKMKKVFKQDYKFFKNYYCYADNNKNSIEYRMMLEIHCLEKGMSVLNPRVFGIKHLNELINLLNFYKNNFSEDSFVYDYAISALFNYKSFFYEKNWVDTDNYIIVNNFLSEFDDNDLDAGAENISVVDIKKYYNVDYLNFMKYRKSVRKFKNLEISNTDMNKVLNITRLTPSACNRQMCKVYYIKDKEKIDTLSKNINGLTCFDLNTLNYFVITYDQNAFFSIKERNQGYFNAGLFTMNFVNSLHSCGIGSCILQGDNLPDGENNLKKILNIPDNERIAVYVVAGYYDDISRVPYSTRKDISEIYRVR